VKQDNFRLFALTTIVLMGLFVSEAYIQPLSVQALSENCPISFQKFAYEGPRDSSEAKFLPANPWEIEFASPIKQQNGAALSFDKVATTRISGEHSEIWLTSTMIGSDRRKTSNVIVIYQPKTQHQEIIPLEIGDTGLDVFDFFTTKDGTVWGKVEWDFYTASAKQKTVPVLAHFNEITRRFELAQGVMEIPIADDFSYLGISILEGQDNSLWIFADNDGIYRYNTENKITQKQLDVDFEFTGEAISPDGSIYFRRPSDKLGFRLSTNTLLQFIPKTKVVINVNIPDEEWPAYSGILFDHKGQLWLGAIGYRDTDGFWHRVIPDPAKAITEAEAKGWAFYPPSLLFESSDGLLWYIKSFDSARWFEGTAWYDPKTNTGCLVSNRPAWPTEDKQHILWMIIDGILYKRSIQ
jgi:hypothetical protein